MTFHPHIYCVLNMLFTKFATETTWLIEDYALFKKLHPTYPYLAPLAGIEPALSD